MQAGLVQTLPEAQMEELDAGDAKERREARKQGSLIWLCVVRNEVVAASYRCFRYTQFVVVVLHFPLMFLFSPSWGLLTLLFVVLRPQARSCRCVFGHLQY